MWNSGSGMPIDSTVNGGRMFLTTGNGTYAATRPFNASSEFGDSTVAFNLANGGLTPSDSFTPFNQARLSSADLDQGSGGILMVPDQQGSNPHVLVQVGKEGRILVLNRDNLGGYATGVTSNTNALQDILGQVGGLWSTPAYWNGHVYTWAKGDVPKMFEMNGGVLGTEPSSKATVASAFPGASFTVSSNGAQDGIAWAVRTDMYTNHGPGVLYAFDATDLTNILYESDTNTTRDGVGRANKFAIAVVTNGKVYVPAVYQVDVYGLFNGQPTAAAPVISPAGGTFASSQSVKLSTATDSASIYYTLDGSTPTPASMLYAGPFTLDTDTTVRAIASAPNFVQSATSSAAFTFTGQVPAPVFSPAGGTYTTTQSVGLADTDAAATVFYTTDGSTPTQSSNQYTGPIAVAQAMTINAIAIDPKLQSSDVASAAYVIQAGGSTINFGNGFASVAGLTLNGSTLNSDDSRLQLTNGSNYEAGSVFWNQAIGIQAFTTDFSFQLSSAVADGFTFTIQNTGVKALGGIGAALGYGGIKKSVAIKFDLYSNAGEGTDSTGVYTAGATPTTPSVDMTASGLALRSGDSMLAHVTYDGTTLRMKLLDLVTNRTFTLSRVINIPQIVGGNTAFVGFTGGTGGLSASQKILYWTYSTQTAIAAAAAPVFSVPAGTYASAQSVSLSSATSGATIYYTTNGIAPTTSSAVYSSAIQVSATETLEAIAVKAGVANSSVSTAVYTIQSGVPPSTVNFGKGFASSAGLSLVDAATVTNNALQVTLAGGSTARGAAWYNTPVSIGAFITDFDFQLLKARGDGFTFTIQNDGASAIGPAGSGLGYGASAPGSGGGLGRSVAIKFDIYNNLGEGSDSTGFYTNGASPTVPATDMTASKVMLSIGHIFHAHIVYDGTNMTLVITDTATSASFTKTSAINIPSIVGAGTAYVGFTGSFGGLSMTTDILDWTLTSSK